MNDLLVSIDTSVLYYSGFVVQLTYEKGHNQVRSRLTLLASAFTTPISMLSFLISITYNVNT